MAERDVLTEMLDAALTGDVEKLEELEREADDDLKVLARELRKCAEEIRRSRLLNPQFLAAEAYRSGVRLYLRDDSAIRAYITNDNERAREVALVYEALYRRRRRVALMAFKLWRRAVGGRKK